MNNKVHRFPAVNATNGKGKDGRGIGSHTDYGLLVIAAQDDVGGQSAEPLQYLTAADEMGQVSLSVLPPLMKQLQIGSKALPVYGKMMTAGHTSPLCQMSSQCFQVSRSLPRPSALRLSFIQVI